MGSPFAETDDTFGLGVVTRSRRRSLLSLTPLIDVVFILLVFFMLASSFLEWSTIDLTTPGRAAGGPPMQGSILVEVRKAHVRFSGERMGLDDLEQAITNRLARRPDTIILVRPAANVHVQRAVDVLDRLSAAGVETLTLLQGAR